MGLFDFLRKKNTDAPLANNLDAGTTPAADATEVAATGTTAAEPAAAAAKSEEYVIKSGDTLSKIAKHYYGDASKYMRIFEANQDVISDPNKIFPGQKIHIPMD
jgi:nucleoid-associated protein YgaU